MNIHNPYWEEAKGYIGDHAYDFPTHGTSSSITKREELVRKYAWSITSPAALELIASLDNKKIIEIGAGSGYWAYMLTQYGMDVKAFDTKDWDMFNTYYYDVVAGGPLAVTRYLDYTLMLCWPPYDTPMAADCLRNYGGRYLIYIGECDITGDEHFHDRLRQEWVRIASLRNSTYFGIHDYVNIFERK